MSPPRSPLQVRREQLGFTQERFAQVHRISRQCVLRAEQGTYTNPPPRLMFALYPVLHDRLEALTAYKNFQSALRQQAAGLLLDPYSFPTAEHPFTAWREDSNLNQIQFCKAFAVQQAIIHRWEAAPPGRNGGPVTCPAPVLVALTEAGYSVDNLIAAYAKYRGRPL